MDHDPPPRSSELQALALSSHLKRDINYRVNTSSKAGSQLLTRTGLMGYFINGSTKNALLIGID